MSTFGGGGGGMGPTATPSLGRGPKVTAPRPVKIAAVSLIDLKEQAAKTPTPARGWAVVPQPPAAPLAGASDLGVSSALFPPVSASKQQTLSSSSQSAGKGAVSGTGSNQAAGSGGGLASRAGQDGGGEKSSTAAEEKKDGGAQSDGNVCQGSGGERKSQEGGADEGAGRAGNKPSTVETNGATLGASVSSSSSTSTGPQGEEETKAVGAGTAGMSLSKLITSTKKVGISVSVRGRAVNTAAGTVKPSGSAWKSGVSGASTSAPSANASSSAQPAFLSAGSATNAVTGSVDEEAFPDLMKSAEQVKLEAQKEKDRQKRAKEALRRVEQQKAEGGGQRRLGLQELFELGESTAAAGPDGAGATAAVPSRPATTQRRWADEEPEEEEDFLQASAGEGSEFGGFGRSGAAPGYYVGCGASPLPQYVMPGMQGSLVAGYLSFMAAGRRDPPPEPPQEPYPYQYVRGDGAAGPQPAPPSVPPPGGVRGGMGAFGHASPSWAGGDAAYQQNALLHERPWRQTSEQPQQAGNSMLQRPQLLQRRGEGLVSAPPRPYLFAGAGTDGVMEIDMEKQRELMRVKAEQKRREEEQRDREQKERAIRKLQELDARLAKNQEQGPSASAAPVPPPGDLQHSAISPLDGPGRGENKNAKDRGRTTVMEEEEDWRRPINGVTPERLPRASSAQPRTAVDPNLLGSVPRGPFPANGGQQTRPPPPPPGGHGGSRGMDRRGPGSGAASGQGASLLGAGNAQSGILPGHSMANNIIEHEGGPRGGSSLIHGTQAQPPPPPSESIETWRAGRGDAAVRGRSAAGGVSAAPADFQGLPPLIRGGRGGNVRQHQQSPLVSGQPGEASTGGETGERPRYRFGALVNKHLEERQKEEEEHSQQPSGRQLSTRISNGSSRSQSAHKPGAEGVPAIEGAWRQSPPGSGSSPGSGALASGRAASAGPPSVEGQKRTDGENLHPKREPEKQQRPNTATVRATSPTRDVAGSAEQTGAQKPLPRGMLPLPSLRGGAAGGSSQHGSRSSPLPGSLGRQSLSNAPNTSEPSEGKGKNKHPPQSGVHSGNWRASAGSTGPVASGPDEGVEGGPAASGTSRGRTNVVEDGAEQGQQPGSNGNSSRREGEDHSLSKGGRNQQSGHSSGDSGDAVQQQSQNSAHRSPNTSPSQPQFHSLSGGPAQAASQKPPLIAAAPLLPYAPGTPEVKGSSSYSQQMGGVSGSKQQIQQQGASHGTGATGKSVKDLHKNATLWQLSSASFPSAPTAPKTTDSGAAGQRAGLLKKPGRGETGQRGGSSAQSGAALTRLGNGGGGDLSFKALLATRPAPAVLVATHTKAEEVQGSTNGVAGSQQSSSSSTSAAGQTGSKELHALSKTTGVQGQANAQQPGSGGRDRPTGEGSKGGTSGRRGLNQRGRAEGEAGSVTPSLGSGPAESARAGQEQRHDSLRAENMRAGHGGGGQQQHGEGELKEGKDTAAKGQGRRSGNGSQGQRAWATVEKPQKKASEDNDTWPQSDPNISEGRGSGAGMQPSSRRSTAGAGTGEQVSQGSSSRDEREPAFKWGAGAPEPGAHGGGSPAEENVVDNKAPNAATGDDSSRSERRLSGSVAGSVRGSGSKGASEPLFTRRSGPSAGRGGRHAERGYGEREATGGAGSRGAQQQASSLQSRSFDVKGRDQQQVGRGAGRGGGRASKMGGAATTGDETAALGNHHQKRVSTADPELGWSRQAPTAKGTSQPAGGDVPSQQQASQSSSKGGGSRKAGGDVSASGGSVGGARGQGNRAATGSQGLRPSPSQASGSEVASSGSSMSSAVQGGGAAKAPDSREGGSSSSGNASPSCAGGGRGPAGGRGPSGSVGGAAVWLPKGATKKVRDDNAVAPTVGDPADQGGGSSGVQSQPGGTRMHGKAPSNSPKAASCTGNGASGAGGGAGSATRSRGRTGSAGSGPVSAPDQGVTQSHRGQEPRGGVSSASRGSTGGSKGQFAGSRSGDQPNMTSQGMADDAPARTDGNPLPGAGQQSENEQVVATPDEEGFQLVKSKRREQQEKRKRVEQQRGSEKGAVSRNRKSGQQSAAWAPSVQPSIPDQTSASSSTGPSGRNGTTPQTTTSGSGAGKRGAQGGRNTLASPREEGKGGAHSRGQGAGGGGRGRERAVLAVRQGR